MTEQLLISSQGATGLPWWASIMCTTLALRTVVTLPLGAYQMVIIGKVEALQSEIAELAKRLRNEVSVRAQERSWTERHCRYQFKKNLRRIVSELYIRDNCHPFKASLLIWVQLPMWLCLSLALRNLSMASSAAGSETAGVVLPEVRDPLPAWSHHPDGPHRRHGPLVYGSVLAEL
ncbi:hypothetical protein NHX12_011426 [Muraenolepis orangiensis]|uniref:Mitochondrial inner membrane protein COX18 n=1 Tax=Muraenolepis orangiensis TaxID=630683 RepID=A0A9Q0I8S6_9TELE|nr:hypothetical protein NHX12_011426 [Muraenolepis orangiensis]